MRRAFSLVELFTVIGTIGLLVGLTLPAIQRSRSAALRVRCANNLRQVGVGLQSYHAGQGRLPPGTSRRFGDRHPDAALGWMALILSEVEEGGLYRDAVQACQADPFPLHIPPHTGFAAVVPIYVCPEDGRQTAERDDWGRMAGLTSYLGVKGYQPPRTLVPQPGVFGNEPGIRLAEIPDGTSQTVAIGERPPPQTRQAGWWYPVFAADFRGHVGPNNSLMFGDYEYFGDGDGECEVTRHNFGPGRLDNPCDRYHFWSLHAGGGNWLFADGSVRFLAYSADAVLPALATRSGGEVVAVPD